MRVLAAAVVVGAAEAYNLDPLKESAPMASNKVNGPRTRREVLKGLREGPWAP